jgi:hypothetical protein
MSNKRRNLVLQAFNKLDTNGDGIIEPDDLINIYDATQHPDVISGRKSAADVLREFLDTFDIGGIVDGKVTQQEFENYYNNLSALIDDDNYFELMMRSSWRISGGEGHAANSAGRRVLASNTDGSQSVEEIQNDLGLRANDKAGVLSRLKAQGRNNASSISLFAGGDSDAIELDRPASARSNPITGVNVSTRKDFRRTSLGGGHTFKIA